MSKLSNLSYENILNYYIDDRRRHIHPEAILPNDKRMKGYRGDIEVKKGMNRATNDANE